MIENAILFMVVVFFLVLENVRPYKKDYKEKILHYLRNSSFSLFNGAITGLSAFLLGAYMFLCAGECPFSLLNLFDISYTTKFIFAFLFFDMWIYCWHRANHVFPFLWRFHRVHHNDPQMDMSTVLRFHPIEIAISSVLNILIIFIVGIRLEHLVFYKLMFHLNVFVHHSNIAFPDRVDKLLRYFIVTPNMHKVHHSTYHKETDTNYSSMLSMWDRLFGSYKEADATGIMIENC